MATHLLDSAGGRRRIVSTTFEMEMQEGRGAVDYSRVSARASQWDGRVTELLTRTARNEGPRVRQVVAIVLQPDPWGGLERPERELLLRSRFQLWNRILARSREDPMLHRPEVRSLLPEGTEFADLPHFEATANLLAQRF